MATSKVKKRQKDIKINQAITLLEQAKSNNDKQAFLNGLNTLITVLPDLPDKKRKLIQKELRYYHDIAVEKDFTEYNSVILNDQEPIIATLVSTCFQFITDTIRSTNNKYKIDQRFIFMIEQSIVKCMKLLLKLDGHKTRTAIRNIIAGVYDITNVKYEKQGKYS